jgi:NAD(P)-dependent dehydrogenase (short-subunit alcohol dehydrogenase family)
MTRVWAMEFAPYRICVNSIAPGFVATPINKELRESPAGKGLAQKVPLGFFGEVQHIVPAVLFLSSEESDYITGQCLVIDGGLSACRDLGEDYRYFDKKKK